MGCILSLQSIGTSTQNDSYCDQFYSCNVYAHQGYHRKQMEDKHTVCLNIPNHPEYSLFGIFDGFNGGSASSYLSENILSVLNQLPYLDNDNAIIDAIQNMDREWLSESEANNAGSTLVFAIVKIVKQPAINYNNVSFKSNPKLEDCPSLSYAASQTSYTSEMPLPNQSSFYIGENHDFEVRIFWAGDSRAITIGKEGEFKSLTVDHNCTRELETKRIKNANGHIKNNRIDGIVAVSRGFGCQVMKNNNNLPQNEQKIISLAECKHITCKQNDTLLIFCDGLIAPNWDNEIIVRNYNRILNQHKNDKDSNLDGLIYLTDQAHDEGSRDNITVMSIQFQ